MEQINLIIAGILFLTVGIIFILRTHDIAENMARTESIFKRQPEIIDNSKISDKIKSNKRLIVFIGAVFVIAGSISLIKGTLLLFIK